MIHKIALVAILICVPILKIGAQINLVKNPGFEKYYRCPADLDEIKAACYWTPIGDTVSFFTDSLGNPNCSPEFCNVCASIASGVNIPWGGGIYYQFSHGGNGMAQVMMFDNKSNYDTGAIDSYNRDYLQGRLYNRLTKNATYCVSFYVILEQCSAFSINGIGTYFDDGNIDTATWCGWVQTSHTPQVYETAIISDTLNWTKVQGTFIANGTEKFITIGQFFDSAHTNKIPTNFDWAIGADNTVYSWYLVDDISVIPIDAVADAGPDRVTTTAGDSVQIGDTTGYLPCQWYANGVLIDSNIAGFLVHPDSTTRYVMVLDVCGHITTDTAVVWVFPSGVQNINNSGMDSHQSYKLYPNPNNGSFTIAMPENISLTGASIIVTDLLGKVVATKTVEDNTNRFIDINLKNVAAATYFVKITIGNNVYRTKVSVW